VEPLYFETPEALRSWLSANHNAAAELWVGFYKKASGKPSVTYEQAVEEALCFGWIDGVRISVDSERYVQRLTPRRRGSNWSAINIRRVEALLAAGRMQPPGLAAYEARQPVGRTSSPEGAELPPAYDALLKARPRAWEFFQAQPPWYRRIVSAWVMNAKQETTRLRRLDSLIADSEAGEWVAPLRSGRGNRRR
jgi:uncharacterized protein YdeI (YjbR/CyaY-like superfamily)